MVAAAAHTRSDSIENSLRDDLAQLRKTLYQRDREIAGLKKQVSQLQQAVQAPTPLHKRICQCMALLSKSWCPCCCQPSLAQQLLAEHQQRMRDEADGGISLNSIGMNTVQDEGAPSSSEGASLATGQPPRSYSRWSS